MMVRTLLILILLSPNAWAAADLSGFAYDQRLGDQVPPTAVFNDEQGRIVTLSQVLGHRPSILVLGYFNCANLCGLVRNDLMNALSRLEATQPYSLVVVSIDPSETPTDARLSKTADLARFGQPETEPDWHYLTGAAADIAAVTGAVGFRSRFDASTKQFLHPAGIVFLTASGTVSSYLLGLGYQPSDVGLGITRAANGVAARALPILLLCFHYDAVTGHYTLAIMRVLQLGAAITTLVVGGTVMLALRRERRPR
jgi:protein SCO1/2